MPLNRCIKIDLHQIGGESCSCSLELKAFKIVFQRGDNRSEFPFWNQLNGPIADALWHVGQVVTFRRSSGNPMNPKVSVLQGNVRQ